MLNNLLKGIEITSSVLIQDSLTANGADLLRDFIKILRVQHCAVHVATFESSPTRFRNRLQLDASLDGIQYHDYCTDHRGWWKKDAAEEIIDLSIVKFDKNTKNVLVVDSISVLISRIGFNEAYRQLHGLIQTDIQLICLVHEDSLPDLSTNITKLRHLFATCLHLSPAGDNSEIITVHSRHIKKGGKVLRKSECYSVDTDNNITVHAMAAPRTKKDVKPIMEDSFPKELTTFKLDLGQSEKAARDKLVLPYLRPEGGGGGKVFYEPDDADDWDDEDPDDDLDV